MPFGRTLSFGDGAVVAALPAGAAVVATGGVICLASVVSGLLFCTPTLPDATLEVTVGAAVIDADVAVVGAATSPAVNGFVEGTVTGAVTGLAVAMVAIDELWGKVIFL